MEMLVKSEFLKERNSSGVNTPIPNMQMAYKESTALASPKLI